MASDTPIELIEIPVGEDTFTARAAGPAGGELVLLLHGFPQSSWAWRHQLEALGAAGYRAVAPDQRGYSPGARPAEVSRYSSTALVSDVIAIADELGGFSFHLVGHDWGAAVAWQVAGRHAHRLRTLTILSVPHPLAFTEALRDPSGDQAQRSSYFEVFRSDEAADAFSAAAAARTGAFSEAYVAPVVAFSTTMSRPWAIRGAAFACASRACSLPVSRADSSADSIWGRTVSANSEARSIRVCLRRSRIWPTFRRWVSISPRRACGCYRRSGERLGPGSPGLALVGGSRLRSSRVGAASDPPNREAAMADQQATLKTNKGDIVINLFPNHAPETVANFVGLAEGTKDYKDDAGRSGERFYDGLSFHRVIDGFMIQGGCPLGTGTGGPGYTFKDEPHPELVFDKPYLLAMANAGPGTNGSQFFITVGKTPHLNRKHTIFGEVADQASRDVVDTIAKVRTGAMDRPAEPVVIETVETTGS